jgi:serine/threonine-protein kinase
VVGQSLAHYQILEKLGEGGMGVVYRARDTRLDRLVALKVLPPEKVADPERKRRFVREAKSASALNHPNIITIHDIGQEGSVDFIAMEYVAGKTLAELIAPKGHPRGLKVHETLKYEIQIADALAAAHASGIVHRDLKPGNVMVTESGLVKVLDFGLAKLTEVSVAGEEAPTRTLVAQTAEGIVVGTAAYMSPEQVEGRPVDARSDIFSFGAVAYEMLSGRRAFAGESHISILTAVLHKEPAPLGASAPPEVEKIVTRCLRKNPEERFQRALDVKLALEEAAGALDRPATLPSIAVLPFANLSADKENEYFSDGLTEEIINVLTKVPGLRVTARTSAFALRGKDLDVREIGARLNVAHILEGSVRKAGNRIRVTAQLVSAADGYHLWSEHYDREMTDVFAIQDEISQAIVDKLRVRLAEKGPLVKRYTDNLEAYNLYLRGRHWMFRWTGEGLLKGRELFQQAIALDPGYALAYAGMAESYWFHSYLGFSSPNQALPRAKAAVLEALRLDDTLAEAHSTLGMVLGNCDFKWSEAEREFRRALELNPASAIVHSHYALYFLRPNGRLEEAESEMRRALEVDPLSLSFNARLGYLFHVRRQFDLAIAQQQRTIELDPNYYLPHWFLGLTYGYTGLFDQAIAAVEKASELSGRSILALALLGANYAFAGRHAEARKLLEEFKELARITYVPSFALALIHLGLQELNQAFEYTEKGVEERDLLVVCTLKGEPHYDVLHSDPRFQALLRKMNLESG